jgi:arsenite transporter
MATGILLGNLVPSAGPALRKGEFVGVSVPIGKWYSSCADADVSSHRPSGNDVPNSVQGPLRGASPSDARSAALDSSCNVFVLNWIVAPLFMVALAWAFLPDRPDLREGLIFVGVARCIAMVLVWNDLAKGDGDYCAVLVAFNSILQIVLYAPLSLFYINVVSHSHNKIAVGYGKVATSVAVFLGMQYRTACEPRC